MAALLFFEMMFTYARQHVNCQLYRRVRTFIFRISGIQYRDWAHAAKLARLALSPQPPKGWISHAALISAGFFSAFCIAQRKNPRLMPMRVSLSCLVPSARSGFCAQIVRANAGFIDLRCHIGLATQPLLGHLQQADRPLNQGRRKQSPY